MALPQTLQANTPAGTASPAQGDDALRGIKDYLRDVYGAPDGSAVAPGSNSPVFTVGTDARATFNWSPLTVPTELRGTASQILRIGSQYSSMSFEINGASVMSLNATGMLMQTQFIETPSGVTMILGTKGAQPLILRSNTLDRWVIDSSGMLWPNSDGTMDLGTTTRRLKAAYIGSHLLSQTQVGIGTSSPTGLFHVAGNVYVASQISVAALNFHAGSTGSLTGSFIVSSGLAVNGEIVASAAPATPNRNTLFADNLVKAWVSFDGTAADPITPDASYNISGTIVKNGTGDYMVTFARPFANALYAVIGSADHSAATRASVGPGTRGTATCQLLVYHHPGNTIQDKNPVCVMFLGTQ